MLLSKKLDKDVRTFCIRVCKRVRLQFPRKKKIRIPINAYPAMVSSCCFYDTPIFHDESHSTANVKFDQRLMNKFALLGGKPGDVVPGCQNQLGRCAEQRACNVLMLKTFIKTSCYALDRVQFSRAYRPRTFTVHPMCNNCVRIFRK